MLFIGTKQSFDKISLSRFWIPFRAGFKERNFVAQKKTGSSSRMDPFGAMTSEFEWTENCKKLL